MKRWIAIRSDLIPLLLILAIGAALRVLFFIWLPPMADGDSFQYHRPAHRLMDGVDFPLDFKRPPAYPVFLAAIGKVFGPALPPIVAIQSLLGLGTAALAYGIGRLSFGRLSAGVGAAAAAISGELLIWEHYLMTEALFTFTLCAAAFLFLVGSKEKLCWGYVGCGLAIGLAALTRPHAQALLAVVPIAALVHHWAFRPALNATMLTWIAAALLLVPWMARNYATYGAFTVAGGMGDSLVHKTALLHPGEFVFHDPTASFEREPKERRTAELIQRVSDERQRGDGRDWAANTIFSTLRRTLDIGEPEADALMRRVAIQAIIDRPFIYAGYVVVDLREIALGDPEDIEKHWVLTKPREERTRLGTLMPPPTDRQREAIPTLQLLATIYQSARLGPLVPGLFVVGVVSAAIVPAWRPALFPGLGALALQLATAITAGTSPRYHHPTVPLVHVMAAGGVLALWCAIATLRARLRQPERYSAQPSLES